MKREEEGKTAQQIMGNMRVKTLIEAAKVLCDVVHGQASVDLTKRREQCMHASEVFVEDLYRHIMRAHAKAIKGSGTAASLKTDRNVYLPFLLQTWQGLAKCHTSAWLWHDAKHQRRLLKKLVARCGLGLDTPATDDDKGTWAAWAERNWQGQVGMITVETRLCAQLRLSVVDGRFVETRRHGLEARPQVAQIRMISNKPMQDKLAGLVMVNDGTLPHAEDIAFTSHERLMDEVCHNAGNKSTGATAFSATAILYEVLLNRSVDLRGRPILRTKSFTDMLKCLKEQQDKVQQALEMVGCILIGERLSVALESMRALHVYESVGVQAAALIQQMTSEQLERTSRKMEQGMGAVSKLRAETVMSVIVTGTRGGCEKNSCVDGTTMFLEKVPVEAAH